MTHRPPSGRVDRHRLRRCRTPRLSRGITAFDSAPRSGGECAGRSHVAVACGAVTDRPAAVDFRLRPFQPFRSWVFRVVGPRAAVRSAPRESSRRGEVAIDRHTRCFETTRPASAHRRICANRFRKVLIRNETLFIARFCASRRLSRHSARSDGTGSGTRFAAIQSWPKPHSVTGV